MKVTPIKTRVCIEGERITDFIFEHIPTLKENSVVVVTSKIVALSEKRTATIHNAKTKEKLVRAESEFAIATKHVWLAIKDNMVMANAGIDESNANGKCILLPRNSFNSAHRIRKALKERYGIKNVGVVITDSRTMPFRAGVSGVALGYAGFRGIRDYRGKSDIFGRKFVFSKTNIADSIATSAVLVMGEGDEQIPLAVIEKAPVVFSSKTSRKELYIDIEDDMYQPFFLQYKKRNN